MRNTGIHENGLPVNYPPEYLRPNKPPPARIGNITNLPGIIIARGGSKRIPRKNVKLFCGRPLVEWTIVQALQSEGVSRVILSTDDDEIACIGKKYDIEIFRRPSMPDNVSGAVPVKMAVERLNASGYKVEDFISLLPTHPCRKPDDIDKAISLYYSYAKPMGTELVSCVRLNTGFYIPQPSQIGLVTKAKYWYPSYVEDILVDDGLLSISNFESYQKLIQTVHGDRKYFLKIRRKVNRLQPYIVPFINEYWQLLDIDTDESWEWCEYFFEKKGLREHYSKYLEG